MKQLYNNYKYIVLYLFFGICTTLINVISYWIIAHLLNFSIMSSTILAWICAISFAYITNRKWVFHSTVNKRCDICKEIISFFMCRLITGLVDWTCMYILVKRLLFNDIFIKLNSNILVIVLNYIASKLFIFKKGKPNEAN